MTLFSAAGRLSLSLFAVALIVGLGSPASAQRKPSEPRHTAPMPRRTEARSGIESNPGSAEIHPGPAGQEPLKHASELREAGIAACGCGSRS